MPKQKVLVFRPDLGVPFKKIGGVQENDETNLPPIRRHWASFVDVLYDHLKIQPELEVGLITGPMWKLTEDFDKVVDEIQPDFVLFPHKNNQQLTSDKTKIYYYMQTVFPWLFTIDESGWGGTHSQYPFSYDYGEVNEELWNSLQERISKNESKFDQPFDSKVDLPEKFILFPCQIPHDETIKYHSDHSVDGCLKALLDWAEIRDVDVVVKGHPVNPSSMSRLRRLTNEYKYGHWVDDISIHEAIGKSDAVYTVNSGTGFEALLHEKPVATFGQSEYDSVTTKISGLEFDDLQNAFDNLYFDKTKTMRLVDAFFNHYTYGPRNGIVRFKPWEK